MTSGGRAGAGLCGVRESSVYCPPHAVYIPWPQSSPGVGATCQVGQDHLPWQGAQQSLQTARGSERAAADTLSVTSLWRAAAQHLRSCKCLKQRGHEGKQSLSSNCCPFLGGQAGEGLSLWPFGSLLRRCPVPVSRSPLASHNGEQEPASTVLWT